MQGLSTSFVFGYHGCDQKVARSLLRGSDFRPSENQYDWLGTGIYFWEANPLRGLEYAQELMSKRKQTRGQINKPAVVGAVLDLGHCLDLLSTNGLNALFHVFPLLKEDFRRKGVPLPENRFGSDKLLRELDCTVINYLHTIRKDAGLQPFDSVRGVFIESDPVYPGSMFNKKTHVQIAITNPKCIKAVFRVSKDQLTDGLA